MRRLLIILLRAYKYAISPFLGNHCRFYPSCSDYAVEALQRHGIARGVSLAARRLSRCHPWHPGGYDPVPQGDDHGGRAASAPENASHNPTGAVDGPIISSHAPRSHPKDLTLNG